MPLCSGCTDSFCGTHKIVKLSLVGNINFQSAFLASKNWIHAPTQKKDKLEQDLAKGGQRMTSSSLPSCGFYAYKGLKKNLKKSNVSRCVNVLWNLKFNTQCHWHMVNMSSSRCGSVFLLQHSWQVTSEMKTDSPRSLIHSLVFYRKHFSKPWATELTTSSL